MSATEVICPDCGKYIAPPGAVEATLRCRCADEEAAANAAPAPPAQQVKRCYVCAADITNRKRLKDHLGRYWCDECARADERAKKRMAENQCPDCGRVFAPNKLIEHGSDRVCKNCYKNRLEEIRKKLVHMGHAAATKRHQLKHIKWMVIILIVLLALATYNQFFR
ncbi:MAG TPA: hypothetical protein VGR35_20390 [Tepidisphaeraceae bacterium]|nr:hypothetical protein [Tepidisphaeraceae bacterium]